MARKSSFIEDCIALPWWFNLILAAGAYVSLKYWVPTHEFENPVFQAFAANAQQFSGWVAALFVLTASISAFHSWRKGELLESQTSVKSFQDLSWKEFEYLVGEAYRRKGYSVVENASYGPDDGIDLVLSKNSEVTLVQCKNWKSGKVGVSVVREHYGIVTAKSADKGIIVCSGEFSDEAKSFAAKTGIELLGGGALRKLIASVQKSGKAHVSNNDTTCPICGSHMVHRVARRGKHAGKSFLGCSRYPKCKGTRS